MGRIVVGVDPTPAARRALAWALDEARRRGASLEVVTAYHAPSAWFGMGDAVGAGVSTGFTEDDLAESAAASQASIVDDVARHDPEVEVVARTVAGTPGAALVDASRGAELLVLGASTHGELTGAVRGSVEHHCVRRAHCPVVVVRSADAGTAGGGPDGSAGSGGAWPPKGPGTWAIDLDGVVWLAGRPLPGVATAVAALRAAGNRTLFVTNNAGLTRAQLLDRLGAIGVPTEPGDLVSSAQAAATLVTPGWRVLPVAQGGATEALAERGAELVDAHPADAVVVGYTRHFDYDLLAAAGNAIRHGARLIGTNDDATYPTPDGLLPGAGSILAAVATAGSVTPTIAGKPHEPLAALVRTLAPDLVAMVGDRPSTDGLFARRLGVPYALVLSGVTAAGDPVPDPPPDVTSADLGQLVTDWRSTS